MNATRATLIGLLVLLVGLVLANPFGADDAPSTGAPGEPVPIAIKGGAVADAEGATMDLDRASIESGRRTLMKLAIEKPDGYQAIFRRIIQGKSKDDLREAAVVAWRSAGDADPKLMADVFEQDESSAVRTQAAATLGHLRDWDGTHALVRGLRDPDRRVREAAHVAVTKVLGFRVPYRAADPPAKREKFVRIYENSLTHLGPYNEDYKRILEIRKEKGLDR